MLEGVTRIQGTEGKKKSNGQSNEEKKARRADGKGFSNVQVKKRREAPEGVTRIERKEFLETP